MTTLGIIGSGNIGSQLTRAFAALGHDIVLANSRGPASLEQFAADVSALGGGTVTPGTVEQASQAGELVVLTVPLGAVPSIPSEPLAGRVVVDTNNYYPARDGSIPELDDERLTTAEWVARHLSESTVVKAFNHIPAADITDHAEPSGSPTRRALMVYGDVDAAVRRVSELIEAIGFDAIVGGPLRDSWRIQRDTPGYGPRFAAAELREQLAAVRSYGER
ncbi:MAG: NADPH-dependent F420 reductase [Microcella sp.]|uniref:NADPH-dependent F420 reductase n=1 Tax=Microcella sp. TaxID=1913979 RepID=UPI003315F941